MRSSRPRCCAPAGVNTKIIDSARNRPDELNPKGAAAAEPTPQMQMWLQAVRGFLKDGFQPDTIAGLVLDAIKSDTFYVVPAQPNIEDAVAMRLEDIRLRRNPTIIPPGSGR